MGFIYRDFRGLLSAAAFLQPYRMMNTILFSRMGLHYLRLFGNAHLNYYLHNMNNIILWIL